MADVLISAHWALINVEDAVEEVVAKSADEVINYIGSFPMGVPSRRIADHSAEAPPWVAFGPVRTPEQTTLIMVSILERCAGRDATDGRRIFPRRVFLIPFDELAACGASYRGLFEALEHYQLPAHDGPRVSVPIALPSPATQVSTIQRYSIDRVGALAGRILEDRIALTDMAGASRDDRLDLLDAAMSLLPYGFRAAVSAATGIDNTGEHPVRIVFADITRDQVTIDMFAGGAIVGPRTEQAARYCRLLQEKTSDPGLIEVIRYLWAQPEERSLQDAGRACEILSRIAPSDAFVREVLAGTITKTKVVDFFRYEPSSFGQTWQLFAATKRNYLVTRVLEEPNADALLRPHVSDVLPQLWFLASERLDAGDSSLARWSMGLAATESPDQEDGFLSLLIEPEYAKEAHQASRRPALVEVLLKKGAPKSERELPRTRAGVRTARGEPWLRGLFRDLLVSQANSMDQVMDWARWLSASDGAVSPAPPWIQAIRLVLRPDRAAPESWPLQGEPDPQWYALFVLIAGCGSNVAPVLALITKDLIRIGQRAFSDVGQQAQASGGHEQDTGLLRQALQRVSLQAAEVAAREVGLVDALRMMLGDAPRDFPADGVKLDQYLDGLSEACADDRAGQLKRRMSSLLLEQAAPVKEGGIGLGPGAVRLFNRWAADPALAALVAQHVDNMRTPPDSPDLNTIFWALMSRSQKWRVHAVFACITAAVREAHAEPAKLDRTVLDTGREGREGLTNTALAMAMYRSYWPSEPPTERLLAALRDGGAARLEHRKLDNVLRELQGLLFYGKPGGRRWDVVFCEYYARIKADALGPGHGKAFAKFVLNRMDEEDRHPRLGLRRALGGASPESRVAAPAATVLQPEPITQAGVAQRHAGLDAEGGAEPQEPEPIATEPRRPWHWRTWPFPSGAKQPKTKAAKPDRKALRADKKAGRAANEAGQS